MAKQLDAKHYPSPEAVLTDPRLSDSAKAEVLRQWKLDLDLELNASDENMPVQKVKGMAKPGADADLSEMLRRVADCLRKVAPPDGQNDPAGRST